MSRNHCPESVSGRLRDRAVVAFDRSQALGATGSDEFARAVRTGVAALLLALLFGACSDSSISAPEGEVTVTGVVMEINDLTPVDGGVTILLAIDGGIVETLHFGSLFTFPPPEPERLELYERVRVAQVGSRVRAIGLRTAEGIELTDFQVLPDPQAIEVWKAD